MADQDAAAQERADSQNDRPCRKPVTGFRHHAGNPLSLDNEIADSLFDNGEIFLRLDHCPDSAPVEFAIGLRPRRAHGRALARIERAELDAGAVDRAGHCAAERVNFLGQVPLANAANRRVAAHLPEPGNALRHQQRARARPRGSQRGFRPGVAAADHYDVVRF